MAAPAQFLEHRRVEPAFDAQRLRLLAPGFLVCCLYDRWKGVRAGLPVVLVMSFLQGGITLVLSQWNDTLNGFIASSVAFGSIFALSKLKRYRDAKPATSRVFNDERQSDKARGAVAPAKHVTVYMLVTPVLRLIPRRQ